MHHPHFLSVYGGLSALVAIFTAWTALDLVRQAQERHGSTRLPWLITAAFAMGGGIWAMHFIAMLGFDPGPSIGYDPLITIASLGLAIAGTSLAFFAASLNKGRGLLLCSGTIMGLSIAGMHYVGMAAIRMNAVFVYSTPLVVASVVIAIAVSTAALIAAGSERLGALRPLAAVALGLAVVSMHYTGMMALSVEQGTPHHSTGLRAISATGSCPSRRARRGCPRARAAS